MSVKFRDLPVVKVIRQPAISFDSLTNYCTEKVIIKLVLVKTIALFGSGVFVSCPNVSRDCISLAHCISTFLLSAGLSKYFLSPRMRFFGITFYFPDFPL